MTPATGRLTRLAEFAHDRRRLVLGGWIAALVVITALGAAAKGEFRVNYSTPGSQSRAAADLLANPSRASDLDRSSIGDRVR